jgi:hypothetical protein
MLLLSSIGLVVIIVGASVALVGRQCALNYAIWKRERHARRQAHAAAPDAFGLLDAPPVSDTVPCVSDTVPCLEYPRVPSSALYSMTTR